MLSDECCCYAIKLKKGPVEPGLIINTQSPKPTPDLCDSKHACMRARPETRSLYRQYDKTTHVATAAAAATGCRNTPLGTHADAYVLLYTPGTTHCLSTPGYLLAPWISAY